MAKTSFSVKLKTQDITVKKQIKVKLKTATKANFQYLYTDSKLNAFYLYKFAENSVKRIDNLKKISI